MRSGRTPIDFQISAASSSAGMPASPLKTVTANRSGEMPSPSGEVMNSQAKGMTSFLK